MNAEWPKACLAAAHEKHSLIPKGTIAALEEMLAGAASEKEMKTGELNALAGKLLEVMAEVSKPAPK